jgi:hypothetical protein
MRKMRTTYSRWNRFGKKARRRSERRRTVVVRDVVVDVCGGIYGVEK